jgi:hypothetical protein
MVETEFDKLNLKLNIMRIMKKELKKPDNKEYKWIKFKNQYKYSGLNLQNAVSLTAQLTL